MLDRPTLTAEERQAEQDQAIRDLFPRPRINTSIFSYRNENEDRQSDREKDREEQGYSPSRMARG